MLKIIIPRHLRCLTKSPRQQFGIFDAFMHYLRTSLNRVRWQQNQQFTQLQQRSTTVPKNVEQQTQLFIATQQQVSLSEQQRMQRIDQILGTKTYFHQGKIFQERLDSDHLMTIDQLRKENPLRSRKELDWMNPQADVKIRYKNKRKYYQLLSQLRTYPRHDYPTPDLSDETNEHTIAFLGAQTAYSTISLKPIDMTAQSLEQESMFLPPERPFQSRNFRCSCCECPKYLLRNLLNDVSAISELGEAVEEVISLDEIYQTLKQYDSDQRVSQYIKTIQNNRVQYLFTDFSLDHSENTVAITLDILDNGIQHCLLVKSLVSKQKVLRPIFNMKPPVSFSHDGKIVYYVQRSAQGGWIELVRREVESCWGSQVVLFEQDEGLIYRASPQKHLQLGKDSCSSSTFLTIRDHGRQYSEKLFVVSLKQGRFDLLEVDTDGQCKYIFDMSSQGLIVGRKREVREGQIKYGNCKQYIESVELVPFKQHIQIHSDTVGLTDLLPGEVQQGPSPQELDFQRKKCIFVAGDHEFITKVEVRNSHMVMVLNYFSVYDRATLYFLPFKTSAHPHSLILKGGANINLRSNTFNYDSQLVQFSQPQGPLLVDKTYNIWKRQLSQGQREASIYHTETFILNEDSNPFELTFTCKNIYLQQKQLPLLLVILQQGQSLDQTVLRQLLEKGVAVVQFCGRGTYSKDLQHFLAGSRHNFSHLLDDLQDSIQFIGNRMTKNISLYCKGQVSSMVGLWFNLYFPYLFNSTVLHNGLYDLSDQIAMATCLNFFGTKAKSEAMPGFNFNKFNVFEVPFRTLTPQPKSSQKSQFKIGQLQNMIISSSADYRTHSRKLIKRLRQNKLFSYQQVYLKEHEDNYSADLQNMSYIYAKIRLRLQKQLDQIPQEYESEDDEKS